MKKIFFAINTLGRAGAETALLELLRRLDPKEYEIDLFVLLGQGEMVSELPKNVRLLNRNYDASSVLSVAGKKHLLKKVLGCMASRGTVLRRSLYLVSNLLRMAGRKKIMPEKLLWRVVADGVKRFGEHYDLAVAYLEGAATYYVADYVNAEKKVAFVHVDYGQAGYSKALDGKCYEAFEKIFTVSDEVRMAFLKHYPEHEEKTEVFHNLLDSERICRKSMEGEGFKDGFDGIRILSVGRLTTQKAFEVSIEAMKLLKEHGKKVRWYVLGEGDQRKKLEELIGSWNLTGEFLLSGAVENPYPYMRQADLYVHASRFEGKSIAIQEAQILGKPILVSDCSGNREQVEDGVDGLLCAFTPQAICDGILRLIEDADLRERLGKKAAEKNKDAARETEKLTGLIKKR